MQTTVSKQIVGIIALSLSLLSLSACAELDDDSSAALATQEQAIFYGTRTPTAVNLGQGQQMAIGFLADNQGSAFCTGTLIDRDVVITASHCTEGQTSSQIQFGLGEPGRPTALVPVARIAEHPTLDAALLFLRDDAVSKAPGTEPIPFLRQPLEGSLVGSKLEFGGYGQTHDNSDGRYFVSLTLEKIEAEHYVVDGGGQNGICFGDSGGPLFAELGGFPVVVGVESYGDESCVDTDYLTRLDLVANWIDQENGGFQPNVNTPDSGPNRNPDGTPQDTGDGPYFNLPGCSTTGATGGFWALLGLPLAFVALRRRRTVRS